MNTCKLEEPSFELCVESTTSETSNLYSITTTTSTETTTNDVCIPPPKGEEACVEACSFASSAVTQIFNCNIPADLKEKISYCFVCALVFDATVSESVDKIKNFYSSCTISVPPVTICDEFTSSFSISTSITSADVTTTITAPCFTKPAEAQCVPNAI